MLEQVRKFLKNTPFQPFVIHCSSGENFRVDHPENAAIVGHFIVVALPDNINAIMISPLHVVGVAGVEAVPA